MLEKVNHQPGEAGGDSLGGGGCPDAGQLERMLLGQLSDDELAELERHVTRCAKCVTGLAGAAADDSLVRAVHDHTCRLSSLRARQASIEAVVERAKRIVGEVGPATSHLAESAIDLGFLSAAQQPEELGRLGDYRILRVLGSGGMGVVFEAEETRLGRRVALKAMRPILAASVSARRRFIREAQAAASVEHDQIVPVYHVGSERGIPFIIMPLLRGETLAARLDALAPHPLPLAEALRIGREIALGLDAAHRAGLIHRDIKPGNIWLEAGNDSAKILDFGLARATTDGAQITHAGALVGTPAYMAPEQARGLEVDARADLFSLGCVLYHIATGVQPFSSESTLAALLSVALSEPVPPRELNRDLPAGLSELILSLLSKDPAGRPASAALVAERLGELAGNERTSPHHRSAARRSHRRMIAALVAASVTILCVAGLAFTRRQTNVPEVVRQDNVPDAVPAPTTADEAAPRQQQYVADMRLAHQAWQQGDLQLAEELLAKYVAAEHDDVRGFEWRYLRGVLQARPQPTRVIDVGHGHVFHIEFSPDGSLLAAVCQGGTVQLWDTTDWEPMLTISGHNGDANWVTFTPDGQTIASVGDDGFLRVWDTSSGRPLEKRRQHFDVPIHRVAFSADGRWIAIGFDRIGEVRLQEAGVDDPGNNARVAWPFSAGTGRIESLAFSLDGKLAIGWHGDRFAAAVWDVANSTTLLRQDVSRGVFCVALSPGGETMTVGRSDGVVTVQNIMTGATEIILSKHIDEVRTLAYSRDGRLLALAGNDGVVAIYDTVSGTYRARLHGHQGRVWSVAFSPDGKTLASAGSDGTVRLWESDLVSGGALIANGSPVDTIVLTDDGSAILVGRSRASTGLVSVVEPTSRRKKREIEVPLGYGICAVSPNGRSVAYGGRWSPDATRQAIYGDPGEILMFDVDSGTVERLNDTAAINGAKPPSVDGMAFTPSSDKLVVAIGGEVQLWDVAPPRLVAKETPAGLSHFIFPAPDGQSILLFGDAPHWWRPGSHVVPLEAFSMNEEMFAAALSADGEMIAAATKKAIHLLDAATGARLGTIDVPSTSRLAFSHDGRTLASGDNDGAVRFWNLATRSELFKLDRWPGNAPSVLRFSQDGKVLITAGYGPGHGPTPSTVGRVSLRYGR